jgi:hypothetical protein
MIDALARRAIRAAVDDFIDGKITSSTFDERLFAIETEDATAVEVISLLWCTYDDFKEHGVEQWGKPTWDIVQRLLLLLDSGAELVTTKGARTWRWSQAVALVGLVLTAWLYEAVFHHWFFPVLIGGAVSIGIAWWRERQESQDVWLDPASAVPFASPAEIRRILRQMPGWAKRRHPGGRVPRLRSPMVEWAYGLNARFLWCLASPVALLFQALPRRRRSTQTVVMSGGAVPAN